jgi:hypothetical protein
VRHTISKLKIIGFDYTVQEIEKLQVNNEEVFGFSTENTQEIKIDSGLSFQAKRETLLHEVIHQLAVSGGIAMKEREVHGLSRLMNCFFQDNPRFVELWCKIGGD